MTTNIITNNCTFSDPLTGIPIPTSKPKNRQKTGLFVIFLLVTLPFSLAQTFTYDANGNMIRGVNNVFGYDSFNNLVQVNDTSGNILEQYTYDDSGNRLTKYETATNTTTYYFDENLVRVVNNSGTYDTYYYYDDQGNLLIRKDSDGSVYYYHPDHLGSTTLVTNATGGVVEKTEYEPYGEVLSGGNDRYTFTGKELDTSGLMYYGARYYDPVPGRFIQPDTLLPDMYNPQALNRYSYALNNPYKYTDPSGNEAEMTPFHKLLWIREERFRIAQANLLKELSTKYYTPDYSGVMTCPGCDARGPPTFKELQEKELIQEFQITISDENNIVGYKYGKNVFSSTDSKQIITQMQQRGFTKSIVKSEIQEQFKQKTGESLISKQLKDYWNQWWKIFNEISEKQYAAKQKQEVSQK